MTFALGRKCYVRSYTVTKFWIQVTFVFVFRPKWYFIFVGIFFYGGKCKMHFRSASTSNCFSYTLRQWFSNIQQPRFRTAYRCLEKLVLPSIFDTSLSSFIIITRSQWSSGSMSDCSARGLGSNRALGSCVYRKNHWDSQPWARAVCTLPAMPRSTQPSTLRRTMAMVVVDDSCLQADSQPKSAVA